MRRRAALLAPLALALGASRCNQRGPSEESEVTVYAAASLQTAFTDLARAFERMNAGTRVRLAFAGSQELRVQLEHGARADVFASADMRVMNALIAAGRARNAEVFAHNALVIVVSPKSRVPLRRFEDLALAPRLSLAAPEVPIGHYSEEVLTRAERKLGSDFHGRVLAHVVSRELSVSQVLAKVMLGEVDAGIVYASDAKAAGTRVLTRRIPPQYNVRADYPVTVLNAAPHPELAHRFVDSLAADAGRDALLAAGLSLPEAHPAP